MSTHGFTTITTNTRVYDPATATDAERQVVGRTQPIPNGTIVYQYYRSTANKSTGKIINSTIMIADAANWKGQPMKVSWIVYTVKCLDGQTRTFGTVDERAYFNRYETLIADHEKKLNTHRARYAKAEAL